VRISYASGDTQETAHLLIDETLATSDVLMGQWFALNRMATLKSYLPGMLPTDFTNHSCNGTGGRGDVLLNRVSQVRFLPRALIAVVCLGRVSRRLFACPFSTWLRDRSASTSPQVVGAG
jgi:hypothetical protein